MREFGKTPRPPRWKRILNAILSFFWISTRLNFMGHSERMNKQRRKTRFHRW